MADVSYNVEAVLKLSGGGAFKGGMAEAANASSGLQASLSQTLAGARAFGSGMMSMAEQAAGALLKVGAMGAGIGVAAGAMMAKGIGSNLSMLEGKSIQLSAVMAAATSNSFESMQDASASLFAQFRKDAITSAGETQDFIGVASQIAGPILGAGKSMAQLHDLTKNVMDSAPAMGVRFEQAGSDVMRMLQGMAGAHEPLFRMMVSMPSLGIKSAEAFNKMSSAARFDAVQKALNNPAFKAGAVAYGNSWEGLFSTLTDQAKTFGATLGGPMFELVKRKLSAITTGLTAKLKSGEITESLDHVGNIFVVRFEEIGKQLARIFPNLSKSSDSFAETLVRLANQGLGQVVVATTKLADHWPEIVQGAKDFAHWIEKAADRAGELLKRLGDGDMVKGLERAAQLYGGAKMAGAMAPMAGGLVQAGSGLAGVGSSLVGAAGTKIAAAEAESVATKAAAQAAKATAETIQQSVAQEAAAGFFGGSSGTTATFGKAITAEQLAAPATMAAGAGAGGGASAGGAAAGGGTLSMILGELASTLLVFGPVVLAIKAAFDTNIAGIGTMFSQEMTHLWSSLQNTVTQFGKLWDSLMVLWKAVEPLAAVVGVVFVGALTLLGAALDVVVMLLNGLVGALAFVATAIGEVIIGLEKAIGLAKTKLEVPEDGPRGDRRVPLDTSAQAAAAVAAAAPKKSQTPPAKGGGKVEVVLKWDLGDGNDEAVYIRSRKEIVEMVKNAKGSLRSGRIPGVNG